MWDGALEPFKQVITTIIQEIFVTSANYKHPGNIQNFAFVCLYSTIFVIVSYILTINY